MKNILVTGGAGFIGSHVVDELTMAGYTVRVLDNLAPPTHDGTRPDWLNPQAELIVGDVTKKEDWKKALMGIDAIIHLAAYMDFHLDFSKYIRTNLESIALLYELIVEEKLPIQKIVAASSQSVYGEGKYECSTHGVQYLEPRSEEQLARHDWEQHCAVCAGPVTPVAEKEDDVLTPLIPYGVSKLASEHLLFALGKLYNIPAVMTRYSIVLGPRQSFRHFYSGALRSFAVNVLNNEPIQMNEDAGQLRDFVHVKDVARAHVLLLQDSRANFESFNVGLGTPTKVYDLAEYVAKAGNVPFEPLLTNRYRTGGARHSVMNIDKLKALGWAPQFRVQQAVQEYLDWVKKFGNLKDVLKKTEADMTAKGLLRQV